MAAEMNFTSAKKMRDDVNHLSDADSHPDLISLDASKLNHRRRKKMSEIKERWE